MIIDFHTHTFEPYVAQRAIEKLSKSANIINYTDGTDEQLVESNREAAIDLSIVLPVATKAMQSDNINAAGVKKNQRTKETGLIQFAAIHPENSNILAKLSLIKGAGFKGIKLHPVFQDAYIDEECYLKLIDAASDLDLITVIHAGEDISYPGNDWASVRYIINMIDTIHPRNVVLAHMGGWNQWDMVESDLAGADVYFDTSFCLEQVVPRDSSRKSSEVTLSKEQFKRLVNKHGADRILFGTDSPWTSRQVAVRNIKESGLAEEDLNKIMYANAEKLLFKNI